MRTSFWVFALGLSGTVASAAEPSTDIQAHIDKVENGLLPAVIVRGDPHPTHTLTQRMAEEHVPGVSIAVLHHGKIEWTKGYGLARPGGAPVDTDTLFQAGSISKPVMAMAVLRLVERKKLSLDADINSELKSWTLPASTAAKGRPVTLRELLTHTGGTTVHGFGGYAAGQTVPTLVQVLDGQAPANSAPIRIEAEPGTKWNYSGGGYTILQLAVTDTLHRPFPDILHDMVLAPIGMTHSSYEQPLPASSGQDAAAPFDSEGDPIKGGAHTYPEMAAAGLWTTPSDIARYAIEVQQSLRGKANHVLSQSMTRQMLTPGLGHWGLGLEVNGSGESLSFEHGGSNAGFNNDFVAYADGDGAVVMTNGGNGGFLADEVIRAIAAEYHWPSHQSVIKPLIPVDPKLLAAYAGKYALSPTFAIEIRAEGGALTAQGTQQMSIPLVAETNRKFLFTAFPQEVEFFKASNGEPAYLLLRQDGQETKAVKSP